MEVLERTIQVTSTAVKRLWLNLPFVAQTFLLSPELLTTKLVRMFYFKSSWLPNNDKLLQIDPKLYALVWSFKNCLMILLVVMSVTIKLFFYLKIQTNLYLYFKTVYYAFQTIWSILMSLFGYSARPWIRFTLSKHQNAVFA